MRTEFIAGKKIVWARIKAAFSGQRRGDVAVAFLSSGASSRLRLGAGSLLAVNASEDAVRSGQTDPREIQKYQKRGVRVFSDPNLHAKVFVVGKIAFVGSANVSRASESRLEEAIVGTRDATTVTEARRFVRNSCHSEIGPEQLKLLKRMWRPPQFFMHGAKSHKQLDFVWAAKLWDVDYTLWACLEKVDTNSGGFDVV